MIRYRDWSFEVHPTSRMLIVRAPGPDSLTGLPREPITHSFSIPQSCPDFDEFVLRCVIRVHAHEAMEQFEVDGERPFFPEHRYGGDAPYTIRRTTPPRGKLVH